MRIGAADPGEQRMTRLSDLGRDQKMLQRLFRLPRVHQDRTEILMAHATDMVRAGLGGLNRGAEVDQRRLAVAGSFLGEASEHQKMRVVGIIRKRATRPIDDLLHRRDQHILLQGLDLILQLFRHGFGRGLLGHLRNSGSFPATLAEMRAKVNPMLPTSPTRGAPANRNAADPLRAQPALSGRPELN